MIQAKMRFLVSLFIAFLALGLVPVRAAHLLIPMDESQTNHLKAYGLTYWVLNRLGEAEWLLNYRGGSFMMVQTAERQRECVIRGISFELLSDGQAQDIRNQIGHPDINMDVVKLEKCPKIAVYSPKTKQPWDDAVTLALTYAEIPYEVVFDEELLDGNLPKYDWLHLHHEDFTGQYGKFYMAFHNQPWYKQQVASYEAIARKYGFSKVSQMKAAVAARIRDFCLGGGFLFAMCSATDTYDIALAAQGVDICDFIYDGDPQDPRAQQKLDYSKTFAFKDFKLVRDPYYYEYSDIDIDPMVRNLSEENDFFSLFDFSAKWDPIPTMLCQNHNKTIKGFMGQTTAFRKPLIKSEVLILGETKSINEARYIHGTYGKGTWTFFGGHDPEDYEHRVGEEPTDLALHPNSPGYRLILNNILFPAAKKKKQKT